MSCRSAAGLFFHRDRNLVEDGQDERSEGMETDAREQLIDECAGVSE